MSRKIIAICIILTSAVPFLFASSQEEVVEKTLQPVASQSFEGSSQTSAEKQQDIPEWLKRTNFTISVGTDEKPKYFLETIQPLLGTQDKDIVFFNQSRISERSSRPTYNLGFGARKIFSDRYLLGTNLFYDYQDLNRHSRAGVGFEAMNDKGLEARINSYIRVSHTRLVKEDSTNYYYERVANGLDSELGTPLPHLPFLKIYGGGYWYNFGHLKNKYGWKGRLEFTPLKYSRINFEVFDDTKISHPDYRLEGAITLAFTSFALRDIIKDIKGAKEAYPKINLRDKVLDRVVRDFEITVIESKQSKATGLTIEAGRS